MAYQVGSSKQILDKATYILDNARPCLTKCTCKIFSKDNKSIVIKPMKIEQMTIIQNFESAYADEVTITVSVMADEAILILSNYEDLQCNLTFNRYDELLNLQDDILPQCESYMIVISNAKDLLKQFTKAEMTSTDNPGETSSNGNLPSEAVMSRRVNLDMQLIPQDLYIKRDRPFNAILQNTDINNVIHYVANLLEIKDVRCVTPDNKREYVNFVIPPMQYLSTIGDYLQEHVGVYAKGLSSYYTQNVLYVYPPFEMNPDSNKGIVHFYKAQSGYYQGSPSYHVEEGDDTHILLNGKVVMENLSEKTVDNVGNYQVSYRAEAVHDVNKEFNGRECTIRNNNLLSISAENDKQPQKGKVAARYFQPTNNPYTMSAIMSQCMCKLFAAEWQYAWPYVIKPGAKVVYHYEDVSGVKTCEGIVSCAIYNLKIATTLGLTGDDNIYAFAGLICARLTSDTDDSDIVNKDQLPSLTYV